MSPTPRLKHVARILSGQAPPSTDVAQLSNELPFLQGNAEFGPRHPVPSLQCQAPSKRCDAGDILISVRAPVGALNIADRPYGIGRGLCAIKAIGCDSQYLWWWIHTQADRLNAVAAGSTYTAVTSTDLSDLAFPELPVEKQRRIADFLDAETCRIDSLLRLRTRQATLVEEHSTALLEQQLCKAEFRSQPLMRLTDPTRPIQYGIVLPGPDYPGGVPIVKGGDVAAGRLDPALLSRTDPAIDAKYPRSRLNEDDLVIAIRGSVGEVARVPSTLHGANLTQDSARITPYGVDANWLEAVIRTRLVQHRIRACITGATITGINIEDLRRVSVPVPSPADQERLGRMAREVTEQVRRFKRLIERSTKLLAERKRALITAAVTGQLDVTTARGVRD